MNCVFFIVAAALALPGADSVISSRPRTPPSSISRHLVPRARRNFLHDRSSIGTLNVPSLAIGTIAWTNDDAAELQATVTEAANSGLTFYDCAERYGATNVEVALGLGWGSGEKSLASYLREAAEHELPPERSVIATKFTPSPWRQSADSVVKACQESARRLGVESIDLYQIHMPDIVHPLSGLGVARRPKDEVYWEGLAECYNRGLIKNVGVSNYGPTMLGRCQEALGRRGVPLASNQINYSLLYRGDRPGGHRGREGAQATLDAGTDAGVATLAYFPLAMGLLTGKYSGSGEGQFKATRSALETRDLMSYSPRILPLLDVMKTLGQKYGVGVSEVALNWVITKGAIPIVGCRSPRHAKSALASLGWRLSVDDVATLEATADATEVEFEGAGFKRSSEKFVGYGVEKWKLD